MLSLHPRAEFALAFGLCIQTFHISFQPNHSSPLVCTEKHPTHWTCEGKERITNALIWELTAADFEDRQDGHLWYREKTKGRKKSLSVKCLLLRHLHRNREDQVVRAKSLETTLKFSFSALLCLTPPTRKDRNYYYTKSQRTCPFTTLPKKGNRC